MPDPQTAAERTREDYLCAAAARTIDADLRLLEALCTDACENPWPVLAYLRSVKERAN